jgi:hypothetical protein
MTGADFRSGRSGGQRHPAIDPRTRTGVVIYAYPKEEKAMRPLCLVLLLGGWIAGMTPVNVPAQEAGAGGVLPPEAVSPVLEESWEGQPIVPRDGHGFPLEETAEGAAEEEGQPADEGGPEGGAAAMAADDPPAGGTGGSGGETSGGTGGFGGGFQFKTDPFSGRFAYSIPIVVPPARQGAAPTLALGYNSGGGNGPCGVGWGLEVGQIERDIKDGVPVKWNGTLTEPKYDETRGFTFSMGGASARLVPTAVTNEWRAEVEGAFLKFTFEKANNRWLVSDKSGNRFYFGHTADSRMMHPRWTPGGADTTYRWGLSQVLDVNGNRTDVTWARHDELIYPLTIAYNGNLNDGGLALANVVSFDWVARSNDVVINYRPGYEVRQTRRLNRIDVTAGGATVRSYRLTYAESASTRRSLLTKVQLFGTDGATPLPALEFSYHQKPASFAPVMDWASVDAATATDMASISAKSDNAYVDLFDLNGDGLPDRVRRTFYYIETPHLCINGEYAVEYVYRWTYQPNTGSGFAASRDFGDLDTSFYPPGTSCFRRQAGQWAGFYASGNPSVYVGVYDLNGDGRNDRVLRSYGAPYDRFYYQTNNGAGFGPLQQWLINTQGSPSVDWGSIAYHYRDSVLDTHTYVDLVDLNGDGLPDRVMTPLSGPLDHFKVQLNTGSGFLPVRHWTNAAAGGAEVRKEYDESGARSTAHQLVDLNGDGLPDRVFRGPGPFNYLQVQFNNGGGFEPPVNWAITNPHPGNELWGAAQSSTDSGQTVCTLLDVNGDGLPDRVLSPDTGSANNFRVQINHGSGFGTLTTWAGWTNLVPGSFGWNSTGATDPSDQTSYMRMADMNGDGLPDRVMRNPNTSARHLWKVQLNQGPFPDLMNVVSNGIGGQVLVTYTPSTAFSHTNQAGVHLLSYPLQVVTAVEVRDGFNANGTTTYAYAGGHHDAARREFRGFHRVDVTSPVGDVTRTYFHQGGGWDGATDGEFADGFGKQGTPYLIERWGSDGQLYARTINRVETVDLAPASVFPRITRVIEQAFVPGGGSRATAQAMTYDDATGNVLSVRSHGEVTGVNVAAHTWTEVKPDDLWTLTTYETTLVSPAGIPLRNKPASLITSTNGLASGRLRETRFSYDSRGNLLTNLVWLNTSNSFLVTGSTSYDTVGNPYEARDAAGVVKRFEYDATRTFAEKVITGTFTNRSWFDRRSGMATNTVDPNNVAAAVVQDVFFRTTETRSGTSNNGLADQWRTRAVYALDGIGGGVTTNYVVTETFEPADTAGGQKIVAVAYLDGLGRTVQTRTESETAGQYRVNDVFHDAGGRVWLQTQPRFGSGSAFVSTVPANALASMVAFDAISRVTHAYPLVAITTTNGLHYATILGGDTNSPVGTAVTVYGAGGDPWVTDAFDAEGKQRRAEVDEWGRLVKSTSYLGGSPILTQYKYDRRLHFPTASAAGKSKESRSPADTRTDTGSASQAGRRHA